MSSVSGTGPAGRISHDDLDAFISGGGRLAAVQSGIKLTGVEEHPVIGLRRKIAEKMAISKRNAAHFSYFEEVDVTELENLRQHLNSTRSPLFKAFLISLSIMFVNFSKSFLRKFG